MDSLVSKLKSIIEAATSDKLQAPNEQLLIDACEAIKARADLPKEAIKIIKQRLQYQNGKVIFLCLELLEMATFYCYLPFQNQIATKDFLQQINALLLLKNLPSDLVDKLLQLLSLWNRIFFVSKDILPQFFAYFDNLKIKKPDLVFPPAYESKYEKYSTKKYGTIAQVEGTKTIKTQDPNSKSGKLMKELELIRDNIILANSIIDEHDPSESVRNNGALTDLIEQLKVGEKKLQGIINDYNFQDETILNFCLELNDDVNKTMDRYNLLSKGRKPNPYNPIKKKKAKKIAQPIQPPQPKIQPPQQQQQVNVFQKIDQPSQVQQQAQQQQEQIQQPKPQKEVNLLDDDEDDLFKAQPAQPVQQNKQEQKNNEFLFQQAPVQEASMAKLPQNSISDAISSLYEQPKQQAQFQAQPQFIPQIPQQQPYNYMPMPMGMNMGMSNNMMRQPMQQPMNMPMQPQMNLPMQPQMNMPMQPQMNMPMQPQMNIQMQPMMGQPQMNMGIQYSMNQGSGQMKQYGLDEINQPKKPFDQIDDMFGLDSKPAKAQQSSFLISFIDILRKL